MFSDEIKRHVAKATLVAAALTLPVAAMAGVVVKSSGPSSDTYKVGTKIADGSRITLKNGDKVTILTSKGTQVFRGAGRFTVGAKPKKSRTRFANFTRKGAAARVRTGAVRTGDLGELERPNLWYVNLAKGGTTCLYDFETVRLWRADASAAATYTIVEPAAADAVEVHFEAEESERVLNSERLMPEEERSYAVRMTGSEGEPVMMSFAHVGEYETPFQLAEMLIEKGCDAQFAMMGDTLEADAE